MSEGRCADQSLLAQQPVKNAVPPFERSTKTGKNHRFTEPPPGRCVPPAPRRFGSLGEHAVTGCQRGRTPRWGPSVRRCHRDPARSSVTGPRADAPLPHGAAEPPTGRRLQRPWFPPTSPRMAGPARARCKQGPAVPLGRSQRRSPAGPPRAAAGPGEPPPAANGGKGGCQPPRQRHAGPGADAAPPALRSRSPALRPGRGRSRCSPEAEAVRPLRTGLRAGRSLPQQLARPGRPRPGPGTFRRAPARGPRAPLPAGAGIGAVRGPRSLRAAGKAQPHPLPRLRERLTGGWSRAGRKAPLCDLNDRQNVRQALWRQGGSGAASSSSPGSQLRQRCPLPAPARSRPPARLSLPSSPPPLPAAAAAELPGRASPGAPREPERSPAPR